MQHGCFFERVNMAQGSDTEVSSYFGLYKNAEGNLIEGGNPVCRACRQKVARERGQDVQSAESSS